MRSNTNSNEHCESVVKFNIHNSQVKLADLLVINETKTEAIASIVVNHIQQCRYIIPIKHNTHET